jgi:hypothetical protein
MWARVVEFMLACWLAISPFIFHYPKDQTTLWVNDFTCSILIALFSLLSFHEKLEKMHLLILLVGLWLLAFGYRAFPLDATHAEQNATTVGLLLLMVAIIPSHSQLPPKKWRRFYEKK